MDFPKRITQHKAQSDSFAILLYHLRDVGIFRGATENDYGIDFEIEIVHNEKVIGKYLKAQVKSSEEIYIRQDGIPTVGKIKQSTLLYWTELSYRTNVIAFAVDIKTEAIYVSKPLFWQATCLLDHTNSTKTIEFLARFDIESIDIDNKLHKSLYKKFENLLTTKLIKSIAFQFNAADTIYAHKAILRNFKNIFELYSDTWHYDAWTEVQMLDSFKIFLECAQILISDIPLKMQNLNVEEKKYLFNFEYWVRQTDWGPDEVSNEMAKKPLQVLMPLFLDKIKQYSDLVMQGKYYWKSKDIPYLKLVHSVIIPKVRTHEELLGVGYNPDQLKNDESFNNILYGD